MYHKYHTKGVVICSIDDSDNKRIGIFTEDLGFVFAKVQSGRVITSKMRSNIQDFSFGSFSLVHTKHGWKLVGANAFKNYFEILESKKKQVAISNVSNLLRRLLQGEEVDRKLFDIVFNFFEFTLSCRDDLVFTAECVVLLRILFRLGFLSEEPEIKHSLSNDFFEENALIELLSIQNKITGIINNSLKAT